MMMNDVIFDIGAFEGQDADFYLKKGYRVVSVEANPGFAEAVRRHHSAAIEQKRLTVVEAAIASSDGQIEFHVHDHGDWSSLYKSERFLDGTYKTIKVPTITPQHLFSRFGVPYYVKIDIESADHIVMDYICTLPRDDRPRYVSCELGGEEMTGVIQRLAGAGYKDFKLVEQSGLARFVLPYPAREGHYVAYSFTGHHSGPFGEETPGDWINRDSLTRTIEAIDWSAGLATWFDVHARC